MPRQIAAEDFRDRQQPANAIRRVAGIRRRDQAPGKRVLDFDGDTAFVRGNACDAGCQWVTCGDPDDSGAVNATDALIELRVAVGIETCALCVCNVDSIGTFVSASDALRVLNAAVGLPIVLTCPPCSGP